MDIVIKGDPILGSLEQYRHVNAMPSGLQPGSLRAIRDEYWSVFLEEDTKRGIPLLIPTSTARVRSVGVPSGDIKLEAGEHILGGGGMPLELSEALGLAVSSEGFGDSEMPEGLRDSEMPKVSGGIKAAVPSEGWPSPDDKGYTAEYTESVSNSAVIARVMVDAKQDENGFDVWSDDSTLSEEQGIPSPDEGTSSDNEETVLVSNQSILTMLSTFSVVEDNSGTHQTSRELVTEPTGADSNGFDVWVIKPSKRRVVRPKPTKEVSYEDLIATADEPKPTQPPSVPSVETYRTVRDYVRSHPGCTVDEVRQFFPVKEVELAVLTGRVFRKGKGLFV